MKSSEVVYAFIDSQNLNLGIRSLGWQLDFARFRLYLRNKYEVEKAFLFLGYIKKYESIYKKLRKYGYELIFKPTVKYKSGNSYTVKGNVDVELVINVMLQIDNFDKCIIASGDGDFYTLIDYLVEKDKLKKIVVPNRKHSTLLKKFNKDIVVLEYLENKLSKKSGRRSRGKQC